MGAGTVTDTISWLRFELLPAAVVLGVAVIIVVIWMHLGALRVWGTLHPVLSSRGHRAGNAVRLFLRGAGLLCLLVALVGPSLGVRKLEMPERSRDVLLAVDMSTSMYARDIAPNRLTRIREAVAQLMERFPGYKYGLVLFAGDAWLRVPFTWDHNFIRYVLDQTSPEDLKPQGTDLNRPLELAVQLADVKGLDEAVVILISDGEHNGDGDPLDTAALLARRGVRVVSVAVGDPAGATIPLPRGGYQKDQQGQMVFSRADRQTLSEIASRTGGVYTEITSDGVGLNPIARAMVAVQAIYQGEREQVVPVDRTAWPLGAAFIMLTASLLPVTLLGGRSPVHRQKQVVLGVLMMILASTGCRADRQAAADFDDGDYRAAADWYQDQAAQTGDPDALANLGASLSKLEQHDLAARAYAAAATRYENSADQAGALYDAANELVRAGNLEHAVKVYEASLAVEEDEDTKYNLEIARRLLQQFKQQQQQKQDQESGEDDKDDRQEEGRESDADRPSGRESPNDEEQDKQSNGETDPEPGGQESAAESAEEPGDRPPSALGVLQRQQIENMTEDNPMKLNGQGSGDGHPW